MAAPANAPPDPLVACGGGVSANSRISAQERPGRDAYKRQADRGKRQSDVAPAGRRHRTTNDAVSSPARTTHETTVMIKETVAIGKH
jgi:hypothetical protein